ncbi:multicopper oxidase domain-containing protein [Actinomycetota bacterium]
MSLSRRDFLKLSGLAAGTSVVNPGLLLPGTAGVRAARAFVPAAAGLIDPALQPKFVNLVPDAMAPGFKFYPKKGRVKVGAGPAVQWTGLTDSIGNPLQTPVFGYGTPSQGFTWPGRTFEVYKDEPLQVKWENKLVDLKTKEYLPHLLPVDTSLHWAYSLHGYEDHTIENAGIPIVMHLHGGHSDFQYDGNPEFFFNPGWGVRGPQWRSKDYFYGNDQQAGTLWYHDHALGITRLNVYAGLAGFYILRDEFDTGLAGNPLGLPVWPYEKGYAIQDRMFKATGELFYPSFPGDPFYDDFIIGEEAELPEDLFPGGGPTALAEFFGDHMIVNGMIWPKEDVEPRDYRLRLLNGCDSRFLVIRFRAVDSDATTLDDASAPLPFKVIGSDQGLGDSVVVTDTLVFEPGSRYDVVFDFRNYQGQRIIMENIGGDAPFGGDFGGALADEDFFPDRQTDRIMAFDVADGINGAGSFNPNLSIFGPHIGEPNKVRQVALFEGKDEFGRLQPLLGANTGTPENPEWSAIAWHSPTTETPTVDDIEEWEIYNFTGDAHPVHVHLVHFEILGRKAITFDSDDGDPGQKVPQHNGLFGVAPAISNVAVGAPVVLGAADGYVENASKDMVTALPEQVTRIKMKFDKTGRYVWHCHILSHEDHEMMRVVQVMPRPAEANAAVPQ